MATVKLYRLKGYKENQWDEASHGFKGQSQNLKSDSNSNSES